MQRRKVPSVATDIHIHGTLLAFLACSYNTTTEIVLKIFVRNKSDNFK